MATGTRVKGRINSAQDLVTGEELRPRHVRAGGPDMSDKGFWNPVKTLDMSGFTGIFGLWV
jgi:hypothetical protein